jgi:hypothetical protein
VPTNPLQGISVEFFYEYLPLALASILFFVAVWRGIGDWYKFYRTTVAISIVVFVCGVATLLLLFIPDTIGAMLAVSIAEFLRWFALLTVILWFIVGWRRLNVLLAEATADRVPRSTDSLKP